MSPETRLKLGVALLILGLIMPAGTLVVAATDWPVAVKTVLSGILLFGFEIMIVPAVALMGNHREGVAPVRTFLHGNPCFRLMASAYSAHGPGHSRTRSDAPRRPIL